MHYSKGRVARQAHVGVPDGTVEEEFGRGGFSGRNAHLYRAEPPVNWVEVDEGIRPRALLATRAVADDRAWPAARVTLLSNADVKIAFARLSGEPTSCFRNADADEILFVHSGEGSLDSDFGPMEFRTGDYLVIPRGTTYRLGSGGAELLVVESREEVRLPERGLLGQHALFDPNVIEVPTPRPPATRDERRWTVQVQRAGRLHNVVYPHDPLNTVGYKGDLTIWKLNVADIRPVMSERYHLPPSAHATFIADSFVLCTFLPRGLETGDPGALKVPFYHSNIDYDEVIFYHDGDFFSREGIEPGMVTFHPQGIHHGPQPQAVKNSKEKTRTDEVAVMIDTLRPLEVTQAAMRVQRSDYWKSWQEKTQ